MDMGLRCQSLQIDARHFAWRHGGHWRAHWTLCRIGFTTILLVTGVMDDGSPRHGESDGWDRYAPTPQLAARAIGVIGIAAGTLAIARPWAQLEAAKLELGALYKSALG